MACCASTGSAVCLDCSVQGVPSGDISVMPQACTTSMPYCLRSVFIIAGGQAEPPITVRRKRENFRLFCATWLSKPIHTVGTPAENVTCSCSNSSYTDLPSSAGPGSTSLAPVSGAEYGKPHALTWNIGTTGSTTSREEMPIASGITDA